MSKGGRKGGRNRERWGMREGVSVRKKKRIAYDGSWNGNGKEHWEFLYLHKLCYCSILTVIYISFSLKFTYS